MDYTQRGRSRSRSPQPRHRQRPGRQQGGRSYPRERHDGRQAQTRQDREERDWVAKEDEFVLKQAKKKAQIRVREFRAKPIDWLAIITAATDLERDVLEEDSNTAGVILADPTSIVDDLPLDASQTLLKDIDHYRALEKSRDNLRFWQASKALCSHRVRLLSDADSAVRGVRSVDADVAQLLGHKTKQQLNVLETQVQAKLDSDEDIDVEYWEHLLRSITVFKARVDLSTFYEKAVKEQPSKHGCRPTAKQSVGEVGGQQSHTAIVDAASGGRPALPKPGPGEDLSPQDNHIRHSPETAFLARLAKERLRQHPIGYLPKSLRAAIVGEDGKASRVPTSDSSLATKAMYDKEAAHDVEADEEVFTAEADVPTIGQRLWPGSLKPRKPKYFNKVQMGYEWNKYNQTHYDQENPPPKVVQGYKFNVFYPDLIDKTKAPTYKIEREHGRKRGQSFVAAGEEDTCIIRFISGPPYEDVAFRIVDKEWDYSARQERGFKSSFDKDILQLHFQFKKVYYRK